MMNWIIQRDANESGYRSAQAWNNATPPDGYVLATDVDIMGTYVSFMGFVYLEIEGDNATKMTGNQELLDKWKEEHPEPEPVEPEPTTDEVLNALIGYTDSDTEEVAE